MIAKLNSLKNHQGFMKYFKNTSWLMGEKLLRIVFSLFVGIWVARYLGPESFGFLSYAISLVALVKIITHLGLDGLAVREIINNPLNEQEILGTVFYLKLIAAFVGFVILCTIAFFSEEIFSMNFWILGVLSLTIFFTPFEVINFWFNAKVLGKYYSISSSVALSIASILKVVFIFSGMSLIWFSTPYLLEAIVLTILYIYFFFKQNTDVSFKMLKFSFTRAKLLLSQSWMIMLGGIFAIIYLKIDQIMLKWLVGDSEVGIYAVAATLSEVWYFIPVIIATSLFPKIMDLKKENEKYYAKRLQQLYDFLFMLALSLAIIVTLISKDLILFLYGEAYADSGPILAVHIWAGIFVFMRALFSKWILIEDVLIFSLITQAFGAIANIILNFYFIPEYGAYGAAIATLLSYATASYFSLLFYSKTREVFWMMSKAIVSPIRYLVSIRRIKNV